MSEFTLTKTLDARAVAEPAKSLGGSHENCSRNDR
jgi:hypothetical protein